MEANKIALKTLAAAIASILLIEALFRLVPAAKSLTPIAALGFIRCLEAVSLIAVTLLLEKDPGAIGLAPSSIPAGFKRGLIWSAGFGILVGVVYIILHVAGVNALHFFGKPPHSSRHQVYIFFLVGGVIGPITEEIFFRGIIYGFFRRWGAAVAVISSTLIFVFIHPIGANLPVTQIAGGLLFALAYEKENSLIVPVTIHCVGNLAIFSLAIFM
jgi:membrane protease YdiL (CAAX protease family)